MTRKQFRVLYRQFLFRAVDLDLIATGGGMEKLLGQCAALLAGVSSVFALGAGAYIAGRIPPGARLAAVWTMEEFLIATTMMVVGLFAVLCWDSTLPDRREVLAFAPLPVRPRTLMLAKVAALGTALAFTICAVNIFTGVVYPFVLSPGVIRMFGAYWITMAAAGAFVFCAVLSVQGLAAQLLPRRRYLRLSSFLQLSAFFLTLSLYFLEPPLATPQAIADPKNAPLLAWLPTYWFLGLLQALNGSPHPFEPLARRAVAALAVVVSGAVAAFVLSYVRTLPKILEEPDILPNRRRAVWSPRFGDSLQTAVVRFSLRTLLRSRQHRVILAGYLGVGFAISLAYGKTLLYGHSRAPWHRLNAPLPIASVVLMCFAVVGVRAAFSLPLALRANWIFRVTAIRAAHEYLAAIRRSLLALAVAPAWAASAVVFLLVWPLAQAVGHLAILALLGLVLADLCLHTFQKIPFTCSYLPGKANIHVTAFASVMVLIALSEIGVDAELRALQNAGGYGAMLVVLWLAALCARCRTEAAVKSPEAVLRFEELPTPAIFALDLHRDGAPLR